MLQYREFQNKLGNVDVNKYLTIFYNNISSFTFICKRIFAKFLENINQNELMFKSFWKLRSDGGIAE